MTYSFSKKDLFRFFTTYGIHICIILFITNVALFESIRFFSFGQSCMTLQEVQSDSRCLYIYGQDVYQKGSRQNPHHGHPCGSDVTKVMPASHLMNTMRYLDPNHVSLLCNSSAPTPTNTPQPPPPTSIPTPTHAPRPTATPVPTKVFAPTATPVPYVTSKPVPTSTPTPTSTNKQIPYATPTPTPIPTQSLTYILPTNTPMPTDAPTLIAAATGTDTPTPTATPSNGNNFFSANLTGSPTPTPTPTQVPTPTPTSIPPSITTLIASQNNLEAASELFIILAVLSLLGTIALFLLKTRIGKLLFGKITTFFLYLLGKDASMNGKPEDPTMLTDKAYYCEPYKKGEKDDMTWVLLNSNAERALGLCDFPWKIKGMVKVSGKWEEKDGEKYIHITDIHPVEPPKNTISDMNNLHSF